MWASNYNSGYKYFICVLLNIPNIVVEQSVKDLKILKDDFEITKGPSDFFEHEKFRVHFWILAWVPNQTKKFVCLGGILYHL